MFDWLKKLFGGGGDAQTVADAAPTTAAATGAATGAPDTSGLLGQVSDLIPGGMPDPGKLQEAIDGLSQPQLQGAATEAMQQLDGTTRTDFGQLLQGFLNQSGGGAQAPAGVAAGDPNALGQSLSGLLKGQGLGALAGIFGAGTAGGTAAAGTGSAGTGGGAGGLNLAGLLSNPMAKAVLAALIPAIMKAFGGKQTA
jgi:hypothetical protein